MSRRTPLLSRPSLLVLVLFAVILFASLPAFAQSTPEEVANALLTAENANDPTAGVALFAPDAVVTLPTGVLDTPEAIAGWQEELAAGNFHIEHVPLTVDGSTVSWSGQIALDRFRSLGVPSLASSWVLTIEDGLIQTFDFAFTPEAFAELQTGIAAASLIAAEAAHDVDAAMALFAPEAVVTLPTGVLDTPEAIRGWQEELAAGNFYIEPVGLYADGGTASWDGEISLDVFRGMGITSLGGTWQITVEGGLITSFTFGWTPAAVAALQAAAPA